MLAVFDSRGTVFVLATVLSATLSLLVIFPTVETIETIKSVASNPAVACTGGSFSISCSNGLTVSYSPLLPAVMLVFTAIILYSVSLAARVEVYEHCLVVEKVFSRTAFSLDEELTVSYIAKDAPRPYTLVPRALLSVGQGLLETKFVLSREDASRLVLTLQELMGDRLYLGL